MTKNKTIIIGIGIIFIIGIGVLIGSNMKEIPLIASLVGFSQEETANEEIIPNEEVTPEQVLEEYNQTRTDEQKKEAIEKIRAIFGEDLEITFKEAKTRYYSCGIPDPAVITDFVQLKVIEVYEDNKGFTTEVDTETNEILKRWKDCTTETQWITADQAQKIAENLLAKLVDNPESYELVNADTHQRTYYTFWRKMHEGEFYSQIPGGEKGQFLSRTEDRFITICSLNGELMSYEYNYALTEEEVEEMAEKWKDTQKWDIEAIRGGVLSDPNAELTFVNWITTGTKVERMKTEEGTILESRDYKTFRVYRDENGYCYDVDEDRNVFPDTETLKGCKTPQIGPELQTTEGREAAIEAIKGFRRNPDLELEYIDTYSCATQFGIGKEVEGEKGYYYETPEEYRIPVEVYQEKEMIGGGCQTYEYEVDTQTNEIVEMRMTYPRKYYVMEAEMTREELMQRCQKTHDFLEYPMLSQTELEEIAMNFLKTRTKKVWVHLKDFEEFKSQLTYSSKGNNHWWRWEDKDFQYYSLPAGFAITGLPPTVQVGISSGGHIINYINNTSHFESVMQIYDQK